MNRLEIFIQSFLTFILLVIGAFYFFPNIFMSPLFSYLMARDNLYSANIKPTPYVMTEPNIAVLLPYEYSYDGLSFRTDWVEKEIKELDVVKAFIFEDDKAIIVNAKNQPDISPVLAVLAPAEIQGFKNTFAYMMGVSSSDLNKRTTPKKSMFLFNLLVMKGITLGSSQEVFEYEVNGNQIYQFKPSNRGSRDNYVINLFSQKGDFHEIVISGPDLDQATVETLVNSIKVN